MKPFLALWLSLLLSLVGCSMPSQSPQAAPLPATPWVAPADSTAVEVRTIVVKMVAEPSDRVRDFTVIRLDGSYKVYFFESLCDQDDPSYMFGPYDSIKHCGILQPNIMGDLINDQAWLDDDLAPFRQYLSCINGWVYLGQDESGQETWFIEMFGFSAFC